MIAFRSPERMSFGGLKLPLDSQLGRWYAAVKHAEALAQSGLRGVVDNAMASSGGLGSACLSGNVPLEPVCDRGYYLGVSWDWCDGLPCAKGRLSSELCPDWSEQDLDGLSVT